MSQASFGPNTPKRDQNDVPDFLRKIYVTVSVIHLVPIMINSL